MKDVIDSDWCWVSMFTHARSSAVANASISYHHHRQCRQALLLSNAFEQLGGAIALRGISEGDFASKRKRTYYQDEIADSQIHKAEFMKIGSGQGRA